MPALSPAGEAGVSLEERARREALTAALMGKLRSRIRHEAAMSLEPTPEGTAQRMRLVAEGWAEALMVLAPELVEDEVSAAISDGLCDPQSHGAELMVLAHLDRALPGTLKGEAVDCVIARKQEDVALWSVLDSWRRTGAALTPSMQELAESALDPRTQRRFMDHATESALRGQVAADTGHRVPAHARGPVAQPTEPSAPEREP